MEGKKFIVGLCGIVVLLLLGGVYKVTILDDRITVSLPSDICDSATLRVTKDDFTLKCGNRIAFQADTIVEYWRTYGQNELGEEAWWVRNNRFVGVNKKHITLELNDYGNYFDITQRTRYRKGRQNIDDGILNTKFTFTKDKVKISYDYEVNNKALHKISMRIKKQYNSFLDASDPNGYTGVQMGDILSYQGVGNLVIDPTVKLTDPSNDTINFNEGDSISFTCQANETPGAAPVNVSFWWNALDGTDFHPNETVLVTGNATVTFTKIIPHPTSAQFNGTFLWNCQSCNGTGPLNCSFQYANWTVDPRYIPEIPTIITPDDEDINLLNGAAPDWKMHVHYPGLGNNSLTSTNQSIWINWTYPGFRDNASNISGIVWNLSYFGTLDPTVRYTNFFNYDPTANATIQAEWNTSNLSTDSYFITLTACNRFNNTLCVNTTTTNPVDIFDYGVNITTGETKIRFSPQPTITKGAALGQTATQGIIQVNWEGSSFPTGIVNLSLNLTAADKCMTMYAYESNTPSLARELLNKSYITGMNASASDPDYIWLWADKNACATTTVGFSMELDLFFGGNISAVRS